MDGSGSPPRAPGGDGASPAPPTGHHPASGSASCSPATTPGTQHRLLESAGLPMKATQVSVVRSLGAPASPQQLASPRRVSQVVDPRTKLTAVGTRSHAPLESSQKHSGGLMAAASGAHRRCNSWGSDGRAGTRPVQGMRPKGDRHSRSPSPAAPMRHSRSPSPARPLSEDEQLYMQGVGGTRRTGSPAALSPRVKYTGARSRLVPIHSTAGHHRVSVASDEFMCSPSPTVNGADSPTRRLQRELEEVNDELEKIYQVADNITNMANQDCIDGRKPGEYMLIGSPATRTTLKTLPSPKQNRFYRQPPAEARTVSSTRPITATLPLQHSVTSSWSRQSSSAFSTMQP